MPATHRCPWPGCGERVRRELWGCVAHWYRLPRTLRGRLSVAYADHGIGSREHDAALDAIDAWLDTQ